MAKFFLERSTVLNTNLDEAWDFFSSPENLDRLTPNNMGFHILTPRPLPRMFEGQIIEYKVKPLLNLPIYWKTEITEVQPKVHFIDNQVKGPYKQWLHKHTFEKAGDKVIMDDHVTYELPLGFLGSVAHSLYVKNRLTEIFDFRNKVVNEIFA